MAPSRAKIVGVDKNHGVVAAIRQRRPVPCVRSRLDTRLMGKAAAAPITIERKRARTGTLLATAQNGRSAARVDKKTSIENIHPFRGLDIQMPAMSMQRARP